MASPPPLTLDVVGSNSFTGSGVEDGSSEHYSSALQNLNPSILVIVIVLAVTVIVSLLICSLLRHLNLPCLRRMSQSSSANVSGSAAATTPVFSSSRRVSPEIPASSVIDSLPLFTFSSIARRSSSSDATGGDCAVCLSKFEQHDLLRLLPLCCHAFHAECIDTWLQSNLTCPLCRSSIFASDSDLMKVLRSSSAAGGGGSDSFRLEIGNISHRGAAPDVAGDARARSRSRSRSYSVGSFEYFVEDDFEVPISHAHRRSVSDNKDEAVVVESQEAAQPVHEANLAADVAVSGRSWLKEYVDRLSSSISSRTMSFRSSGRFFTGGVSHRSDTFSAEDFDVDANRLGEEISETFRWLSGV